MRIDAAGLLIDLDGTVYDEEAPIPGAAEAVEALRRAGLPLRFVTNTTRVPRSTIAEWLAGFGVTATAGDIFTPPLAAAAWLRERGIKRVLLCLPEHTFEEFPDVTIDEQRPEAVVVGDLGTGWTFDVLNRAFNRLLDGAEFLALHRNRYWKTAGGLALDAGAFVAALEYASGRAATLVGKPSRPMFEAAAGSMGLAPEDVAMVGDSLESDVAGAKAAGCRGILVRTGKRRAEELVRTTPVEPDLVVDSIADLPGLLLG
jgi:HAD superfamily hydrolase (TIGR01458 family)